ncbi:MAG: hypothetical protein LBL58_06060 [Tannerellaceae bacterium]|nr:hypothetical protein [Tannerellaceae bacterium]
MKKMFSVLIALCLCAGLSAQKREGNVVKVQGHVHELLTRQAAQGKGIAAQAPQTGTGTVYNINPDDVTCTIGCTTLDTPMTNPTVKTAYLMVKWTDEKAHERGDSILIWKYQWVSQYTHPIYGDIDVSKYSIDMIRAVANFDARFSVLLQNTGGGNFTVGGFGYNFGLANDRVPLRFDFAGAEDLSQRDTIHFHYGNKPNCLAPYNQFVSQEFPTTDSLATLAIYFSSNTGVIKHPLDAAYGYPAYDYDFWKLAPHPEEDEHEWQAGWNYNYWSFNVRQGLSGDFTYPITSGIATEPLDNNTVHYFVFASTNYNIPVYLDGDYSPTECGSLTFCKNCAH